MDEPDGVGAALVALRAPSAPGPDTLAALPREPGLVAWWVVGDGLPGAGAGALAVGAATSLRNRVVRQDLYRTGVSWPRRCLAGLLQQELSLHPVWAADVVLPRADEDRLTEWMHAHLQLSWHRAEERGVLLDPVTEALDPLLRAEREPARSAEARFTAAAGTRPRREPGVPYRRP